MQSCCDPATSLQKHFQNQHHNLTRISHKFSTALWNTLLRLKATAGHAGTGADFVGFAQGGGRIVWWQV